MSNTAYLETIGESATAGSFVNVGGIKDANFSPKADVLDTTAFNSGTSAKTKILGMREGTATLTGDWLTGDTGQAAIRAAQVSGADIYIQELYDGTNGHYVKCKCSAFDIKSAVAGLVTFSCTLEYVALPVAVGTP